MQGGRLGSLSQLPLCAETGRKKDNLVLDSLDDRNCSREKVESRQAGVARDKARDGHAPTMMTLSTRAQRRAPSQQQTPSKQERCGEGGGDAHEDDNSDTDEDLHLRILPPHCLSDLVSAPSEALRRDGQVVAIDPPQRTILSAQGEGTVDDGGEGEVLDERLVLECVQSLSSLGNALDVLPHHILSLVDLLLDSGSLGFRHQRGA